MVPADRTKQMPLLKKNRPGRRISVGWTWGSRAVLAIFLFLTSAADTSRSEIPAPPTAKPEPAARIDPLGRETPRRAVMGLLKYSASHDFANAARYLQPTPGHDN